MRRYRTIILSTLILIAGSFAHPPAALAQPVCGSHQSIAENLKKSYTETPVSMGITSGSGIIEAFSSPKGTWTLVITQSNGVSCLIAAGQDWEELPKPEMISGAKI